MLLACYVALNRDNIHHIKSVAMRNKVMNADTSPGLEVETRGAVLSIRMAIEAEANRLLPEALARLETKVEQRLVQWGLRSRSRLLARGEFQVATGVKGIVLAGVPVYLLARGSGRA